MRKGCKEQCGKTGLEECQVVMDSEEIGTPGLKFQHAGVMTLAWESR